MSRDVSTTTAAPATERRVGHSPPQPRTRISFDPAAWARALIDASPVTFWCALLATAAAVGMLAALLALAGAPFFPDFLPGGRRAGPAVASAGPFSAVVAVASWLGPAASAFLAAFFVTFPAVAAMAALQLPLIHRGGPVARSFERSCRAATAAVALGALFGLGVVAPAHAAGPWLQFATRALGQVLPSFVLVWLLVVSSGLSCAVLWLLLTARAVRGAQNELFSPELPPRCEGCGYDLTTRGLDERCSECGLPVRESLTPARRPGAAFAARPTGQAFWAAVLGLMLRPTRWYGALRLRPVAAGARAPLDAARRFARRHYVLLWSATWLWIVLLLNTVQRLGGRVEEFGLFFALAVCTALALAASSMNGLVGGAVVAVCGALGLLLWASGERGGFDSSVMALAVIVTALAATFATLCAWALHRCVAAAVFVLWTARRALPDFRWAGVAICYEVAYLWWYALALGALLTAIIVLPEWLGAWSGRRAFMMAIGAPPEFLALLLTLLVLTVHWLFRYDRVLRAIRWSNF